ncbi:unnamed protein product [Lupinus luteus]|uniref:Uncharacterized protein n=1 Tax=Lupinus luteus TaxID=3873 RepID=A0AAV1Y2C1_LUPLU
MSYKGGLMVRVKEVEGFEAYVGVLLLNTAFVGVVSEWQHTCSPLMSREISGHLDNLFMDYFKYFATLRRQAWCLQ